MKRNFKFLVLTLCALFMFMPSVFAAGEEAMIGTAPYATLEEAYAAAVDGDKIVLQEDVALDATLVVKKDITIDLNGHVISKDNDVIHVDGGSLILDGKGTIKETAPYNAGVRVIGGADESVTDYSYLKVGKDITIEGWGPVFVPNKNGAAFGVKIDIYGTLIGKRDTANDGAGGVYVNGLVQNKVNYPVINIYDGAEIDSDGIGLFLQGYAKTTVGKVTINSTSSAIVIKSGILTLNGTTVKATGAYAEPTANNNGVNSVGAAIQIESNALTTKSYAGGIELTINGGTYESANNSAIVEYVVPNEKKTSVEEIAITDGEFKGAEGKDVITASDEFKKENTEFVTGGTFSSSVKEYLAEGLTEGTADNNYQVIDPTKVEEDANDGAEGEKEEAPKKEETKNPNTADINVVVLVSTIIVGVVGLGFTLRKRKFN